MQISAAGEKLSCCCAFCHFGSNATFNQTFAQVSHTSFGDANMLIFNIANFESSVLTMCFFFLGFGVSTQALSPCVSFANLCVAHASHANFSGFCENAAFILTLQASFWGFFLGAECCHALLRSQYWLLFQAFVYNTLLHCHL